VGWETLAEVRTTARRLKLVLKTRSPGRVRDRAFELVAEMTFARPGGQRDPDEHAGDFRRNNQRVRRPGPGTASASHADETIQPRLPEHSDSKGFAGECGCDDAPRRAEICGTEIPHDQHRLRVHVESMPEHARWLRMLEHHASSAWHRLGKGGRGCGKASAGLIETRSVPETPFEV
jgi:hypothetical protein